MPTKKDFKIDQTKDGYRVSLISDDTHHTHLKTISGAQNAVKYICGGKIPKRTSNYYLISLIRLSSDKNYINKIQELIDVRLRKGCKDKYFKPHKKSF